MTILSDQKRNILSLVQNIFLKEKNELINLNVEEIYKIAKFHSIEYIIYEGLKNYNINIDNDFEKRCMILATKSVNQSLELNEIKNAFSINGIDFMPLKGAVLQKLYPRIEYRNMTDIDILIRKNDVEKAAKVLKELSYKYDSFSGNHYVFTKAPYMHLELHIDLIHKSYDTSTYYNDIWNSVRIQHDDNNINEFVFTDNDFYIYHIIHMAKHFCVGGSGLRTIIDFFIYLKEKKDYLDFEYIDNELEKVGLKKLSDIVKDCIDYIFYHQEKENIDDILTIIDYIFDSGTYGHTKNSSIVGVVKEGNKKKYIFRRLFPTYKEMKARFLVLEKVPILLPIFYVVRIVNSLSRIRVHKNRYVNVNNITEDDINEMKRIREIIGVD
ncbi:MAG: nucleotidyltransferase family protein [Bacilli bacterium]|nr:nucleotidyltransferase family protein [Bacilli bacterium]